MKLRTTFIISAIAFFIGILPNISKAQINGINYQAVAVDEEGKEIAGMDIQGNVIHDKSINVRFTIIAGSANGATLYQETHTTYTDPHGLFSLVIGQGQSTNIGSATSILKIDWSTQNQFLKVEIAYKDPNEYKLMGIQQLFAVPFAYYALNAKNIEGGFDKDSTNELQTLSINGNELSISKGNTINLPSSSYVAGSGIQILGNTISNSAPNQNQVLSISNDTLFLTNGGFVKLPANT